MENLNQVGSLSSEVDNIPSPSYTMVSKNDLDDINIMSQEPHVQEVFLLENTDTEELKSSL